MCIKLKVKLLLSSKKSLPKFEFKSSKLTFTVLLLAPEVVSLNLEGVSNILGSAEKISGDGIKHLLFSYFQSILTIGVLLCLVSYIKRKF